MFDYIKELTENNDHTQAYIEGCDFLGLSDLAKELYDIKFLHTKYGDMPEYLNTWRHEVYTEMMGKAKELMIEDASMYQEFRAAF